MNKRNLQKSAKLRTSEFEASTGTVTLSLSLSESDADVTEQLSWFNLVEDRLNIILGKLTTSQK